MPEPSTWDLESLLAPDGLPSSITILLLVSLFSLLPSLLLLTTLLAVWLAVQVSRGTSPATSHRGRRAVL